MNNRQKTEEKVFSYMEKHSMTSPGHRIVVGVSGGADSVCLLFVLLEYAKRVPLKLAAVHINHGIRQDAGEDAAFVEMLCRQEGVPFFLREVDVNAFADSEKCSAEEAGRILRYRAFQEIAAALPADRIAVAHNGNDLAETTLFHLFRGSGLKGLCGIPPVREEIIRPLLCLQRDEIEGYLKERGIIFRTDSTNLEDDYTRNRIRHYVLPFAQERVSAGAVAHICHTTELLSEVEEYLEQQTEEAMSRCVEIQRIDMTSLEGDVGNGAENDAGNDVRDGAGNNAGDSAENDARNNVGEDAGNNAEGRESGSFRFLIDVELFGKLHGAIQKRLLLRLIKMLSPGHRDIAAVHVEEVLTLFEKEGNPALNLPFDIIAERSYGQVLLWKRAKAAGDGLTDMEIRVELPQGETKQPVFYEMGDFGQAEISVFFLKKGKKIPQNQCTKWFDCDKIMESPILRFRRTGDFFCIADGHGGMVRKILKDYMITEKIPRRDRGNVPLLAEGNHVLWLMGYRISEYYKINENTKRVLQVKLLSSCLDSGTEEKDGGTHQGTFIGKGSRRQDSDDR